MAKKKSLFHQAFDGANGKPSLLGKWIEDMLGMMTKGPELVSPVGSMDAMQRAAQQPTQPSPTPTMSPEPRGLNISKQELMRLLSSDKKAQPTPEVMGSSTDAMVDQSTDQFLETKVFPITRKYGIPDAVAAGQFAAEGRLSGLGAKRNNFFNINAHDANPNAAFGYRTPEEGIEAFAKFITGDLKDSRGEYVYPSDEHQQRFSALKRFKNDPVGYLRGLSQAGYAGDPKTYRKRADNGFSTYDEFVMNTPEFRKYNK